MVKGAFDVNESITTRQIANHHGVKSRYYRIQTAEHLHLEIPPSEDDEDEITNIIQHLIQCKGNKSKSNIKHETNDIQSKSILLNKNNPNKLIETLQLQSHTNSTLVLFNTDKLRPIYPRKIQRIYNLNK